MVSSEGEPGGPLHGAGPLSPSPWTTGPDRSSFIPVSFLKKNKGIKYKLGSGPIVNFFCIQHNVKLSSLMFLALEFGFALLGVGQLQAVEVGSASPVPTFHSLAGLESGAV